METKRRPKVITISGKMGAGKDTLATYIKEELEKVGSRVLITHFADLLKYILKTFFDWDGKKDERGRYLLQYVGTDVYRDQYHKDYWCNFLSTLFYLFGYKWDFVIIADTRFRNEISCMKSWFYADSVQVVRPEIPEEFTAFSDHESEHDLDDYEFDYTCMNDEGLEKLRESAREIAGRLVFERVRGSQHELG